MTVSAKYSDGTALDVTDKVKIEYDNTVKGKQKVVITYTEGSTTKTASFYVNFANSPDIIISGDVNANGTFNLVDIILVQKWLLADQFTELSDPDANLDGKRQITPRLP